MPFSLLCKWEVVPKSMWNYKKPQSSQNNPEKENEFEGLNFPISSSASEEQ